MACHVTRCYAYVMSRVRRAARVDGFFPHAEADAADVRREPAVLIDGYSYRLSVASLLLTATITSSMATLVSSLMHVFAYRLL